MNGIIFDIKKFAINDGPGIRTAVFVKGCPLSCLWCHNPESQSFRPELAFSPDKCIGCGFCAKVCPHGCFAAGSFDRSRCVSCGQCTRECYTGARELIGRSATVEEVMAEVRKDRVFYQNSGGGMTISGGEPLAQSEFTLALLQQAKQEHFHTCLDTCGFAAQETVAAVFPYVDLWLYDIKETDPERHLEYTQAPLAPILDNLNWIDAAGGESILRCPVIPGLNDRLAHAENLAEIANRLRHVREINLMPYHPLGESKLARLGRRPGLGGTFAETKDVEEFRRHLAARCHVPVIVS